MRCGTSNRVAQHTAPEFLHEFENAGRIYGYRYRPEGDMGQNPLGDEGRCVEGKAFQVMIDNNLSFEHRSLSYELVTYGERGQVCQNWIAVPLLKQYLEVMTQEQNWWWRAVIRWDCFIQTRRTRLIITNSMMGGHV